MALGEFELIRRYFERPRARADVVLGIGDDAALLDVPAGRNLVVAVDTLVAGRHFLKSAPPRSIGHRALAVNLSDLAAMGATPAWATLSLTMPGVDEAWLAEFAAGFFSLAEGHRVALVGGDTTAGPLTISVQVLGTAPQGQALRRSGARVGDLLLVTGTLGDAAAGLEFLRGTAAQSPAAQWLISRHEYPTPRIELGLAMRPYASGAMDLSDGLVGDLEKLVAASGVCAVVDIDRLPISPALLAQVGASRARELALAGGDDYELLLSVPPARLEALRAAAGIVAVNLTEIGHICAGVGVTWSMNGAEYSPVSRGYEHFSSA
jgi:thiamine-monophosphate kinase